MISVLRAADRIAVPWKNGGGVTREVAIRPPGASVENFDWRVSIAEVREAGPFSRFDNIDRTLMILRGRLGLKFDDANMELSPGSAPFAFAGDAECFGTPIGGPVMDLNVMVRRGRCAARVAPVENQTHQAVAKITLVVARDETMVRSLGRVFQLQPLDALLLNAVCDLMLVGKAFVIAID